MAAPTRLALALTWLFSSAHAADLPLELFAAYQQALANDATFLAARAAREAGQEYVPQARAALLPSIAVSGSYISNNQDQTTPDAFGRPVTENVSYDSEVYQLTLKQSIYRKYNWAQLHYAEAQENYSEAFYRKEWLALVQRVVETYTNILLAEEAVLLAEAHKNALAEQLTQAQRFLKAGEGTRTDVDDAKARHDMATADLIDARNALIDTRHSLQEILGSQAEALYHLNPDQLPLGPPGSPDPEEWVRTALEKSPALEVQRANLEAAKQDVEKARSGHYPTLDLIAGLKRSASGTENTVGSTYDTAYIGVQYALTLYGGGGVSSAVRQAHANEEKARQQLEAANRSLATQIRKEHSAITLFIAKTRALQQAATSAESAFVSTRKGFEAGVRTQVDILNAEEQAYLAKRDLAKARLSFAYHWLMLQILAGTLEESGLQEYGRWFTVQRSPVQVKTQGKQPEIVARP